MHDALQNFPESQVWERPGGVASVAFHLQHLAGVPDRLFTYARGEQLSPGQLESLQKEGKEDKNLHLNELLHQLDRKVDAALVQLKATTGESLLELRHVGRKRIPSNVLGLLFHTAEHMQRHTGQLLVTAKILTNKEV